MTDQLPRDSGNENAEVDCCGDGGGGSNCPGALQTDVLMNSMKTSHNEPFTFRNDVLQYRPNIGLILLL